MGWAAGLFSRARARSPAPPPSIDGGVCMIVLACMVRAYDAI